jgi:hypothetical protein
VVSTHITAQALPFDWTPPGITIPDLIVVKCGYVRFVRRSYTWSSACNRSINCWTWYVSIACCSSLPADSSASSTSRIALGRTARRRDPFLNSGSADSIELRYTDDKAVIEELAYATGLKEKLAFIGRQSRLEPTKILIVEASTDLCFTP